MPGQIRNKVELLLALLSPESAPPDAEAAVVGITRLEKLIFLLKMEEGFLSDVSDKDDFHFVPFRMGPWTSEIYDEIDFLVSLGLVEEKSTRRRSAADAAHTEELFGGMLLDKYEKSPGAADENTQSFQLTARGRAKAIAIWKRLSDDEKASLMRIKQRFNSMNLRQFLRYVYQKYPQYTTASEIKETLGM